MSLAGGSPEPIPTDTKHDPLSDIGVAVVAYPEDQDVAGAVAAGLLPAGKPRSTFRRGVEVFLENKLAVTGLCIFAFMLLFCVVGPLIYHTKIGRAHV